MVEYKYIDSEDSDRREVYMVVLSGKTVCSGIAIGRIKICSKKEREVTMNRISDVEREIARYESAKATAIEEINVLYKEALDNAGKDKAEIFNAHISMLEDEIYNDSVLSIISKQKNNAEYAVSVTRDALFDKFSKMEDEYISERSADIKDISERIIRILNGTDDIVKIADEPTVIFADSLSPSEILKLNRVKPLAIVTRQGTVNSHTAILTRSMNIPSLTNVEISDEYDGLPVIVDGYSGKIIIDPSDENIRQYMAANKEKTDKEKQVLTNKGLKHMTKSGQMINLYANIDNFTELSAVIDNGADGVGLFRTEFLYLGKNDFPTEEEQFLVYKQVAEAMEGKKVIIRTVDVGSDKQAGYLGLAKEENPALGYRGIRVCLTRPDVFKTQLRAIYRASAHGNVAIMYPMIISVEEVRQIKEISESVREELLLEGYELGCVEEGIMIETPAAAIMSDELAKSVDFFSIGTNDLLQYTLAIDRQNSKLDSFYDPHHPAILRLIKMVVENANKAGIRAEICGELGSDITLTKEFVSMGIENFSVSPGALMDVRMAIMDIE